MRLIQYVKSAFLIMSNSFSLLFVCIYFVGNQAKLLLSSNPLYNFLFEEVGDVLAELKEYGLKRKGNFKKGSGVGAQRNFQVKVSFEAMAVPTFMQSILLPSNSLLQNICKLYANGVMFKHMVSLEE
ncbi:uncharacterized protein LOC130732851 isoform X2 [Lotus japonicus]|uniref:uncharacterized protein LOC130732851 isoform X2 n=1 Tax=Lotus japonicus TaxID=34305 RepID=UPI00258FFE5D|nr:uncharacterized protein LOC130732851 isoform X2 [Lotus japonicus]